MAPTWIARALAGIALLAWLLTDFAVAAAGGPGESALEGPLLSVGWAAYLLGAIIVAILIAGNENGRQRLVAALVAVVLAWVVVLVLDLVLVDRLPDGWFSKRIGDLIAGAGLLVLTMSTHAVRRRRRARDRAEEARKREQEEAEAEDDPAT